MPARFRYGGGGGRSVESAPMKAARILVVDDDLWIQRTTASVLGSRGTRSAWRATRRAPSRSRPGSVPTSSSRPSRCPRWTAGRGGNACARCPPARARRSSSCCRPATPAVTIAGAEPRRSAAAQAVPGRRSRADHRYGAGGTSRCRRRRATSADAAATAPFGRSPQAVGRPSPAVRAARRAGSDLAVERARRARDGAQERHPAAGARGARRAESSCAGVGSSARRSKIRRRRAQPPSTRW